MDKKNTSTSAVNGIYRLSLEVLHALFIRTNGWWANKVSDPLRITPLGANPAEYDLWEDRTTSDTKLEQARKQY